MTAVAIAASRFSNSAMRSSFSASSFLCFAAMSASGVPANILGRPAWAAIFGEESGVVVLGLGAIKNSDSVVDKRTDLALSSRHLNACSRRRVACGHGGRGQPGS